MSTGNSKRPYRLIVLVATVVLALAGVVSYGVQSPRYLGESKNGRARFVAITYARGTRFSAAFGNKAEAWIRDRLIAAGFHVQMTSLKMTSPPDSHLFILEYAGDLGMKPTELNADLVLPDGSSRRLLMVCGDQYGLQKRQFVCWVLNGLPQLDRGKAQLKLLLPGNEHVILPLLR